MDADSLVNGIMPIGVARVVGVCVSAFAQKRAVLQEKGPYGRTLVTGAGGGCVKVWEVPKEKQPRKVDD